MKIKLVFFIILNLSFLIYSCATDNYSKRENPRARSNAYYTKTDRDVAIQNYGISSQEVKDSSVGCSLVRR